MVFFLRFDAGGGGRGDLEASVVARWKMPNTPSGTVDRKSRVNFCKSGLPLETLLKATMKRSLDDEEEEEVEEEEENSCISAARCKRSSIRGEKQCATSSVEAGSTKTWTSLSMNDLR